LESPMPRLAMLLERALEELLRRIEITELVEDDGEVPSVHRLERAVFGLAMERERRAESLARRLERAGRPLEPCEPSEHAPFVEPLVCVPQLADRALEASRSLFLLPLHAVAESERAHHAPVERVAERLGELTCALRVRTRRLCTAHRDQCEH